MAPMDEKLIETFPEFESKFSSRLNYCNRILELPNYHVWGCSPIWGNDGKVHVFFSRWSKEYGHHAWLSSSEVAHAVADQPEGPYEVIGTVLKGEEDGSWDSWTIHNPSVYAVDDKYVMLYMGNNGHNCGHTRHEFSKLSNHIIKDMTPKDLYPKVWAQLLNSQAIGMAVCDDLNGPWRRVNTSKPLVGPGNPGEWDERFTSNPAFIKTSTEEYRVYYKSLDGRLHKDGNRKYGITTSHTLEGPYTKLSENPTLSLEATDKNSQLEDAYIWHEDGSYHCLCRDMGYYNHKVGLYLKSSDGISWSQPEVAYYGLHHYDQNEFVMELGRSGRFERPQLLFKNNRPTHMFGAIAGGRAGTSSGAVFSIQQSED